MDEQLSRVVLALPEEWARSTDAAGASIVDLGQQLNPVRRNQVIPVHVETLRQAFDG